MRQGKLQISQETCQRSHSRDQRPESGCMSTLSPASPHSPPHRPGTEATAVAKAFGEHVMSLLMWFYTLREKMRYVCNTLDDTHAGWWSFGHLPLLLDPLSFVYPSYQCVHKIMWVGQGTANSQKWIRRVMWYSVLHLYFWRFIFIYISAHQGCLPG